MRSNIGIFFEVEEIDGHEIPVGEHLLIPIERGLNAAWAASEVR